MSRFVAWLQDRVPFIVREKYPDYNIVMDAYAAQAERPTEHYYSAILKGQEPPKGRERRDP